ncbi:MAG: cobyrinate a,c-diamide synthase [Rhodobacteraceae bacterium]|nr:cobyrinate a,c-diamide synthase [Paracoccaceae bacterium]
MAGFMIAAAHKSSGKTMVSTGLAHALADHGVQTFKKGPDYIDPMWLGLASGRACYNLDYNVMDADEIRAFYQARAGSLSLVEANKGLFDGVAFDGSDASAALAKLLQIPVVLVVDCSGITRGIAPLLIGYQAFDKDLNIAGVILNKTATPRHEGKLMAAVETYTDLPVLGAISRRADLTLGERHLGLITPSETEQAAAKVATIGRVVAEAVDLDAIRELAKGAADIPARAPTTVSSHPPNIRVAIARDRAFGFYYPDDIEAFAMAGAELVPFDTLSDPALPESDALFIGGGFPETQAAGLAANQSLRADIKQKIENGLPTYAECGGLMYLSNSLNWQGQTYPMVGVVAGDVVMHERPQGRGYTRFAKTTAHPWPGVGNDVRAHEFHYASIENLPETTEFARRVLRGTGIDGSSDGIVIHNLLAGFCHLRATASNPWVENFVNFVRQKR